MPPNGNMTDEREGWLRLGDLHVNLQRREVLRNGERVQLSWRAFEALCALVEAQGAVVERDKLFARLWPGVHVEDSSLNHCIVQLRKALGENVIETIPRVGYRLLLAPETAQMPETPPPAAAPEKSGLRLRTWIAILGGVCALAAAAGTKPYLDHRERRAEALRLTDEARHLVRWGRMAEITQAMEELQRAVALDPGVPVTHALIAEAMARSNQAMPGQERLEAERAVQMDPNCGECHAILGWILMTREWRWNDAREEMRTALRVSPNDAYAHSWHSQLIAASGQFDAALKEIDTAVQLDPLNQAHFNTRGVILYLARRYSEAVADCQHSLGLRPAYPSANDALFRIFMMSGRYEEGIRAKVSADTVYSGLSPDGDERHAANALNAFREGGIPGAARHFLGELSGPQAAYRRYDRALWKIMIDDRAGALDELKQGLAFRQYYMMYLRVDPAFDRLHGDKEFTDLVAKIGL